jgi:cytochrome c
MNRLLAILLMAALPLIAGCGNKPANQAATDAPNATPAATTPAKDTTATAAAADSEVLATSQYDDGPRAAEGSVDMTMAAAGEKLFTTRGCTACHAYGKKLTGPDLKGVTTRRTKVWMMNQIMSPEVMTRTDPIAHRLKVESNNLQMLNLHLTQSEAQSLVEYFKKLDAAK